MTGNGRWRLRALGGTLAFLALVGLGVILVGSASATGTTTKKYSASIAALPSVAEDDTPADAAAEAWAGATPTVKITLTNLASPQSLGSANLSVPAGVTISPSSVSLTSTQPSFAGTASVAGGVIKLRDLSLAPNASVTLSVGVQTTCAPTAPSYAFTTTVKQSNDFNGTGNDFVIQGSQPALDLVGTCSLAFSSQPADAQRATAITSEIYLPTGAPVKVAVLDGSGCRRRRLVDDPDQPLARDQPGRRDALGRHQRDPRVGRRELPPQIDKSASGYTLKAASAGITATAAGLDRRSRSWTPAQRCVAGQTCTGTTSAPKTTASVSGVASATNDILTITLGAPTTPTYVCAGLHHHDRDPRLQPHLAHGGGVRRGQDGHLHAAEGVRHQARQRLRGLLRLARCPSPPSPALRRRGGQRRERGRGHLRRPALHGRRTGRATLPGPAAVRVSRVKDRNGNVTLTITAPPGDPRVKF